MSQKTVRELAVQIANSLNSYCLFDGAADTSPTSWAIKESSRIIEEHIKEYLEQNQTHLQNPR